tara:strand:- start:1544 stop:1972 length:429 start_codon:yes stop_codon:yes gene_type:complete
MRSIASPTRKELEVVTRQKLEEMDASMTRIEQINAQTEIMLDFYESKYVASIGGEGIIRKQDIPILYKGVQQVFDIMKDGKWYTIPQLRERTGQEGADRRMRELRQNGYIVDRRRVGDSRMWEYRLDLPNQQKQRSLLDGLR